MNGTGPFVAVLDAMHASGLSFQRRIDVAQPFRSSSAVPLPHPDIQDELRIGDSAAIKSA